MAGNTHIGAQDDGKQKLANVQKVYIPVCFRLTSGFSKS